MNEKGMSVPAEIESRYISATELHRLCDRRTKTLSKALIL